MTSRSGALLGVQRPRLLVEPVGAVTSAGLEAVELAAECGLILDDWQQFVLDVALGERKDGKWAARTIGLNVSRQNGKGSLLEARELAGLVLFGEKVQFHTAHLWSTSLEAFRRLIELVENCDDLKHRILNVSKAHGEEGIEFKNGARVRFVTRSEKGGRGLTGDLVVFDEAMFLAEKTVGALLPAMSAKSIHGNPQIWYTGSAPLAESTVWHRVRSGALAGKGDRLAYFEFSAADDVAIDDRAAWAQANPALGVRISEEWIAEVEFPPGMSVGEFKRERLGIPDAPLGAGAVLDIDTWHALANPDAKFVGPVVLAVDSAPDQSSSAIVLGGLTADGVPLVQLVEHDTGSHWVVGKVLELVQMLKPAAVTLNPGSPAGAFAGPLTAAGVKPEPLAGRDFAQACQLFRTTLSDRGLCHHGQASFAAAVDGARRRDVGDVWVWARRDVLADISPLVAATEALWFVMAGRVTEAPTPGFVDLSEFVGDDDDEG